MKIKLKIEDCFYGLNQAIKNAERLYAEGLQLEKEKSPTATFLYAIALEELGKAHLLGTIIEGLIVKKEINWSHFWKMFKSHKFKQTAMFSMMRLGQELLLENFDDLKKRKVKFIEGIVDKAKIRNRIKEIDETIAKTDNGYYEEVKWKKIYIDFQNGKWTFPVFSNPEIFIKENVETYLIDINTMRKDLISRSGLSYSLISVI